MKSSGKSIGLVCLLGLGSISQAADAKSIECLVEPSQVIEVKAPIEGLIEKVNVDRGDFVKQGQVLISLDMGVDKARYDQAKFKTGMLGAQLAAKSRLEFSNKKFGRDEALYKDLYVSENDRDESESGMKLASAELVEAKENNSVAALQVREYQELMKLKELKSPFDGVVLERSHHPGEVAQANDHQPILKLAKIQPLFVEVVLQASALGKVHVGDEIKIKPLPEGVGEFLAKVTVVDPVLDAASGTLGVRLEVANKDKHIPGGISCQAEFPTL